MCQARLDPLSFASAVVVHASFFSPSTFLLSVYDMPGPVLGAGDIKWTRFLPYWNMRFSGGLRGRHSDSKQINKDTRLCPLL